ncbi:MAG: arylsulfatase [Bacteroidales bacterium]
MHLGLYEMSISGYPNDLKMEKKAICQILVATGALAFPGYAQAKKDTRPNIIVILVDDLGYSDLGCYGGEIHTPHIDGLAEKGLRFTHFYNASRSCPTRASLLTGLYQHQAGIGRMTFNQNLPGYRGTLTQNAVTIAEVVKDAGYHTGMIGKWHVAETPLKKDQRDWLNHQVFYDDFADKKNYPVNRGFDRHYGIIYGVVDYFDPFSLVNGEEPVVSVPEDYYITDALSDSAVAYVDSFAEKENPFFLYLAYTAPHWPLHALPEDIAKYENTYKVGWDAIRNQRYQRMKEMNLFAGQQGDFLSERYFKDRWEDNPTQEWDARAMAVHAAMVDRVDQGIGRLIETLKANKQLDNTLILFLSDNGCSDENCQNYSEGENDRPDRTRNGEKIIYPRKKEVLPGSQTSYASVGPKWANVANTPFRFWKARSYEGGICTPMIAFWPNGIKQKKGSVTQELGHVIDLMATCVDVAQTNYPSDYNGNPIIPIEGKSLLPVFKNKKRAGHDAIGFEHFRERALIGSDKWKIVKPGDKAPWELYDLNTDRSEQTDLAEKYPRKVAAMVVKYEQWANRCLVEPHP